MTKTTSTLMVLSALTIGSTARAAEGAPHRGEVTASGPARKAVVVGPVAIHAYSGFAGGAIYTALAVTGTDADCQGPALDGSHAALPADSVIDFRVGAGQIACLETTTMRGFELLWHAQKDVPAAAAVRLASAGR